MKKIFLLLISIISLFMITSCDLIPKYYEYEYTYLTKGYEDCKNMFLDTEIISKGKEEVNGSFIKMNNTENYKVYYSIYVFYNYTESLYDQNHIVVNFGLRHYYAIKYIFYGESDIVYEVRISGKIEGNDANELFDDFSNKGLFNKISLNSNLDEFYQTNGMYKANSKMSEFPKEIQDEIYNSISNIEYLSI